MHPGATPTGDGQEVSASARRLWCRNLSYSCRKLFRVHLLEMRMEAISLYALLVFQV